MVPKAEHVITSLHRPVGTSGALRYALYRPLLALHVSAGNDISLQNTNRSGQPKTALAQQ